VGPALLAEARGHAPLDSLNPALPHILFNTIRPWLQTGRGRRWRKRSWGKVYFACFTFIFWYTCLPIMVWRAELTFIHNYWYQQFELVTPAILLLISLLKCWYQQLNVDISNSKCWYQHLELEISLFQISTTVIVDISNWIADINNSN